MKQMLGVAIAMACVNSCAPAQSEDRQNEKNNGNQNDTGKVVSWHIRPSSSYVFNSVDGEDVYLYVQLQGGTTVTDKPRVPVNISVVLDRSGSMGGDKMAYAIRAANFLVQQLGEKDIVSIVNYDDVVEVTSPAAPLQNKEVLQRKISALSARGSTNLTGGMLEGYTQVERYKKEGCVNRVLLLTDGLANAGITDPGQIKQIVSKQYQQKGIALSTFGLGADYNEDLLTVLAETGRANYYFIDNPDKIPGIFAAELKGLLNVVAQNATVQITIPPQLRCRQVYGYPYEISNQVVTVRLNDVYAEEEKGILFRFGKQAIGGESLSFDCQLQYTNPQTVAAEKQAKRLTLAFTSDKSMVTHSQDSLVQEMIALFDAAAVYDDILAKVDAGQYEEARIMAESAVKQLQIRQTTIRSVKLKKQEETISAYVKDLDRVKQMQETDKKLYQKANKATNYEVRKGKVKQ